MSDRAAIFREHRQCGTPYQGCYSHVPMDHCRACGMAVPCDVMRLAAIERESATVPPSDPYMHDMDGAPLTRDAEGRYIRVPPGDLRAAVDSLPNYDGWGVHVELDAVLAIIDGWGTCKACGRIWHRDGYSEHAQNTGHHPDGSPLETYA
jgi:hypothetical protein